MLFRSTVTLAPGAYGHDGVKAGASGATYTFAASGLETTLTITAGSLILPIEAGLNEGGSYVASNAGTAPVRVWQGTGSTSSGVKIEHCSRSFRRVSVSVRRCSAAEKSSLRPASCTG